MATRVYLGYPPVHIRKVIETKDNTNLLDDTLLTVKFNNSLATNIDTSSTPTYDANGGTVIIDGAEATYQYDDESGY